MDRIGSFWTRHFLSVIGMPRRKKRSNCRIRENSVAWISGRHRVPKSPKIDGQSGIDHEIPLCHSSKSEQCSQMQSHSFLWFGDAFPLWRSAFGNVQFPWPWPQDYRYCGLHQVPEMGPIGDATTFAFGFWGVPSGKRLQNYGESPFFMGKSTTSMAIFNSKLLVYQRLNPIKIH